MATSTRLLLGSALVLLGGLAATWFLVLPNEERPRPVQDGPLFALRWRAGTSQHYDFLVDASVALATLDRDELQPFRQRVEGVLEVRTLDCGPDGALVGMRLDPVELQVSGTSDPETNRALAAPFRVRFAPDGLPTGFEFSCALDALQRALLEELLRTFQLALRDQPTWTVEERHGTGTYAAEYVRTELLRVQKTKLRYVSSGAAAESTPSIQVVASTASIRFDPARDWIGGMVLDETLTMRDPSGARAEVTTHAVLELTSSTDSPPAQPELWAFEAREPSPNGTVREERPTADPGALAQELRDSLTALDAATAGRSAWIHRMRDLLQQDPELAFLLLEVMKEQELADNTRADLYLVFELAGTPQAQTALCRVATEPSWSQRDGLRALIALGGVVNPTEESLDALWATSSNRFTEGTEDLASTAALALGSLANRMCGDELEGYASLRNGLVHAAWNARDARERAVFALALGNTGDPSLCSEVLAFLADEDPRVRKSAVQALGKLDPDAVGDELLQHLQRESSSQVRASIAATLAAWKSPSPEAMESIRRSIADERDEVARFNLARFLGQNLAKYPENRPVLRDLLASEQSHQIRRYVGGALGESGSLGPEKSQD